MIIPNSNSNNPKSNAIPYLLEKVPLLRGLKRKSLKDVTDTQELIQLLVGSSAPIFNCLLPFKPCVGDLCWQCGIGTYGSAPGCWPCPVMS